LTPPPSPRSLRPFLRGPAKGPAPEPLPW
jgi:hypothetical protein